MPSMGNIGEGGIPPDYPDDKKPLQDQPEKPPPSDGPSDDGVPSGDVPPPYSENGDGT